MLSFTVLDLLRGLSLLAWGALALFSATVVALGLGLRRRSALVTLEEEHKAILAAAQARRSRVVNALAREDSVMSPRRAPDSRGTRRNVLLTEILGQRQTLLATALWAVAAAPRHGLASLRDLVGAIVDDADPHGEGLLGFLYVGAPAAGCAGTMTGVTAALHAIGAAGGGSLASLPLGDINDALLTTFVGCAIVISCLFFRWFCARPYRRCLVTQLLVRAGELLREIDEIAQLELELERRRVLRERQRRPGPSKRLNRPAAEEVVLRPIVDPHGAPAEAPRSLAPARCALAPAPLSSWPVLGGVHDGEEVPR